MTSLCLVTQMLSSSLVTERQHETIKEHLIDCKLHQEFILQRSTHSAPLQTGNFMIVQKVISKINEGKFTKST